MRTRRRGRRRARMNLLRLLCHVDGPGEGGLFENDGNHRADPVVVVVVVTYKI